MTSVNNLEGGMSGSAEDHDVLADSYDSDLLASDNELEVLNAECFSPDQFSKILRRHSSSSTTEHTGSADKSNGNLAQLTDNLTQIISKHSDTNSSPKECGEASPTGRFLDSHTEEISTINYAEIKEDEYKESLTESTCSYQQIVDSLNGTESIGTVKIEIKDELGNEDFGSDTKGEIRHSELPDTAHSTQSLGISILDGKDEDIPARIKPFLTPDDPTFPVWLENSIKLKDVWNCIQSPLKVSNESAMCSYSYLYEPKILDHKFLIPRKYMVDDIMYQCPYCIQISHCQQVIAAHMIDCHGEDFYLLQTQSADTTMLCSHCNFVSLSFQIISNYHFPRAHGFVTMSSYGESLPEENKETSDLTCPVCFSSKFQGKGFIYHMLTKHLPEGESLGRVDCFQRHNNEFHRKYSYCLACYEIFAKLSDLNEHFASMHASHLIILTCSTCGHRCMQEDMMINHLNIHSRENKFWVSFLGEIDASRIQVIPPIKDLAFHQSLLKQDDGCYLFINRNADSKVAPVASKRVVAKVENKPPKAKNRKFSKSLQVKIVELDTSKQGLVVSMSSRYTVPVTTSQGPQVKVYLKNRKELILPLALLSGNEQ